LRSGARDVGFVFFARRVSDHQKIILITVGSRW
jgi:hypothetical protein